MAASVSERLLLLELGGTRTRCALKRHLSPRTVGAVMRSLPVSGRVRSLGGGVLYLKAGIDSGLERPRSSFCRGDVAFLPSAQSICFFTADAPRAQPMTPLGSLGDGAGLLDSARPGDTARLYEDAA